ncbi:discoidin domain-containing receptor 2-like isoform X1 [Bombus vosnesenskii]|uniref:Discoidin domain-containing receptor 2-like isoform X1 n=7 Tax=Pyrobombus TaxID=144703 RepID=A0A6J3K7X0_9HYME|nr:discoidin domain-containing receptor 2 isoform X1 [Bombus impatiens]XP_012238369.1 discoidin domain-containing receptor 2 isoform X1 [Bombus impatiens]XP_024221834.1 discoidin domain-containing receptor 2 isoform X1 [Bombus impatiens]XP_033175492.1 discoidin domain-containing receptor 2 isoform X1 [Bombus impatiens]XP_033175493.1 discoidin domain-containing receptor 2 isoform X1 [Bombus impatiens]XP_033175494.1 discoidin domain-containing receptor 2 isoform X1 [Bombus impatiens]XP_03318328
MRSESSTVSDEEEQVVGSPMAQVTSNMPVLEPKRDLGPLRGLLIGVFLLLSLPRCRCFDLGQCTAALGMENGEIPDEDISASSMYDPSLGPKHARLRQDKGGGAWCPKNMVTKEGKEYLEVNLHSPRILTSTRTQGRFGNGQGVEYTEEYFVEYWRPGFNKWVRWRNRRGMELLAGNNNPYSEKEQVFDPAIVATKVRFIPYTSHMRIVCIRVELYGCPWTDGLVSYSMPQGIKRGSEVDLSDRTYDGREEGGYLSGGLGQLVDGQKGPDNFRLDVSGNGKGYEWVGWRNDTPSMLGRPVEITFEFDYSRNFTAIHLHMNNYFTKDVQVFSYAKVYLGTGGNQFNGEPVHFSYIPDLVLEQARDVTIKLHSRAGRFLKLQLYFAARWIMLSEVIFESVISEWNNTDDEEPRNKSAIVLATGSPYQNNEGPLQRDEVKATFNKEENNDNALPDKTKEPESKQFVGLVIGILTTVIVMLLAAIMFIFYRNRRLKAALAPSTFYDQHGDLKVSVQEEGEDKGPICPPLPAQYHPAACTMTTPQLHKTITDYSGITEVQPVIPLLLSTAINLARPIPPVQEYPSNPPPIPPPPEKYYASTEICKNSLPPLPPSPTPSTPPPMSAKASSSMTSYSPEDMLTEEEDEVPECILDFPREKLNIVENLGCGYFGDVHICEVDRFPGYDEVFRNTSSDLVIVKSLRPGSLDALRIEFQQEAKRLARLADRNVARLLGASLEDDPMCIVSENGEYGDLNQYLQSHIAETSTVHTAKTLSFGTLVYMATQIASGMKHLEEMDFVHRDLATRNCLVSRGYTVKVSDLGSGRNAYAADYFRVEGRPLLPIRWMAWESMLMGRHTSKSDVWSFAVTLWEILTFAREQPFEELSDHRIVENATYFYQEDDRRIILPLPKNCPKDIYELMRECWHRNDVDRPNFREIHMFLQRKNLGYKHVDSNDT